MNEKTNTYRGSSANANFNSANFITANFQNIPSVFALCEFWAIYFISNRTNEINSQNLHKANRSNEINSQKIALAQYFAKKNRTNEINSPKFS